MEATICVLLLMLVKVSKCVVPVEERLRVV